ncbi:MAG: RagB/SusD family nutrient uptake outer membrane protein [Bacteroidaceae bacterium]|nr:RagB/SusD family nutrient uptake outer membrane protein [Bacteroidaceae bacterium]
MVYRKSMVWLRYAEALNRAGYPGYAFAILKNGMTRNSEWLPSDENDFAVKTARVHYEYNGTYTDAEGNQKDTMLILPANWEENNLCVITGPDYDSVAYKNELGALVAAIMAEAPEHFDTIPAEKLTAHFTANIKSKTIDHANFQPSATAVVCDYISRNEWEKAKGVIWLDFNKGQFDGIQDAGVNYVEDFPLLQNTYMQLTQYPSSMPVNEYVTRGIHQKGCGLLKYNEKESEYNYVDQINLKLEAAGKPALTKVEIYDPANQADVIEAIEELILDEAGLELAFEGNRFFDLMRVANRKANPAKFMAEKIKARGTSTEAWVNALESDIKNWYLPLPDYSYRK